jgi:hypothetical protein
MTKQHPTEGDVKKGVKLILNKHGWFWWMPPAAMYAKTGISDFNALKDHVFMAIETKHADNKPTKNQEGFLASVLSSGGYAFVVNEDRLPILDAFLTAFAAATQRTHAALAAGEKEAKVSESDAQLMVNCIRSLSWEIT